MIRKKWVALTPIFTLTLRGKSSMVYPSKASSCFTLLTITKEKTVMRGKLAIILLVVFFASPLLAQELTGTLQQIKKSGQIRIGYRAAEPPMSFLGKDGNPAGYSIDICRSIVNGVEEKIGADVKVEYLPVTTEERFKALEDNRIDILCGSTTKTLSP